MRVLITGASGLLGGNLMYLLPKQWKLIGFSNRHILSSKEPFRHTLQADLLQEGVIETFIEKFRPDSIIHTAALTDVDRSERDLELAYRMHTEVTTRIAKKAAQMETRLVHISTDQVFDGSTGQYKEESTPFPLNQYAKTKLEAERAVAEANPEFLIVRTNFFGYNMQEKNDLAGWIRGKLAGGEKIGLFTDVIFSPILVNTLVTALVRAIEGKLSGIVHIAARDFCSKYEFGHKLAVAFGLDSGLIYGRLVAEANFVARRPKNMSLSVEKFEKESGKRLPTVDESISRYKVLFDEGYAEKMKEAFTS